MSAAPVLDPSVLAKLRQLTVPGEPDVLGEVLTLFLEEVPPRIARLRNAWASGNIEEMQRAAHSLKGSAGNIGAEALHEVCRQIDDKGRSGDLSGLPALMDTLASEFGKVEGEIHRLMKSS